WRGTRAAWRWRYAFGFWQPRCWLPSPAGEREAPKMVCLHAPARQTTHCKAILQILHPCRGGVQGCKYCMIAELTCKDANHLGGWCLSRSARPLPARLRPSRRGGPRAQIRTHTRALARAWLASPRLFFIPAAQRRLILRIQQAQHLEFGSGLIGLARFQ